MIFGIVRGAERAAADAGYTLIVAESQESGEREAKAVERVLPAVDGLVLATTRLGDAQISRIAERKPTVVINRALEGLTSILPDVERGVGQLVAHLADLGHRSVAYLSGPETSWISARRWDALLDAAPRRGMSIVEIGPGSPTLDGGAAAISRVVASGATAVVAFNDLMAIGLLRAAVERGIAVPSQLSITGLRRHLRQRPHHSGHHDRAHAAGRGGERAVRHLLGRVVAVERRPTAPCDDGELLPTELVVRGSTGHSAGLTHAASLAGRCSSRPDLATG